MTIDNTFVAEAIVDYRARVNRVQKEFKPVIPSVDKYELRFPVEISTCIAARSVTIHE